jgi:hypothetical protein
MTNIKFLQFLQVKPYGMFQLRNNNAISNVISNPIHSVGRVKIIEMVWTVCVILERV